MALEERLSGHLSPTQQIVELFHRDSERTYLLWTLEPRLTATNTDRTEDGTLSAHARHRRSWRNCRIKGYTGENIPPCAIYMPLRTY